VCTWRAGLAAAAMVMLVSRKANDYDAVYKAGREFHAHYFCTHSYSTLEHSERESSTRTQPERDGPKAAQRERGGALSLSFCLALC